MEHDCADGVVEVDGGLVPVEHVPLQTGAAFFDGCGCDLIQQRLADSLAAKFGKHEEVFKVQAGALPCGVDREIEREACGLAVFFGDEAFVVGLRAEAVAQQLLLGDLDGVGLAFVLGESANEGEDERDIGSGSWADVWSWGLFPF